MIKQIPAAKPATKSHTILRLPVVIKKAGISRSSIYAGVKAKTFPKPIDLGERSIGWLEADVDSWIESRIVLSRG